MIKSKPSPIEKQIEKLQQLAKDAVLMGVVGNEEHAIRHILENEKLFQEHVIQAFNPFQNEECPSTSSYKLPILHIAEQLDTLRVWFPECQMPDKEVFQNILDGYIPLPEGAECWLAVPNMQLLNTYLYKDATRKLFTLLHRIRKNTNNEFKNGCVGKLSGQFLRQTKAKKSALNQLRKQQPDSEILIIPIQSGLSYAGKSVRRVRELINPAQEFELGAFEMGILMLMCPERLQEENDLWAYCSGDEYSPQGDGNFDSVPVLRWFPTKESAGLGSYEKNAFTGNIGTATGFHFSIASERPPNTHGIQWY